MTFDQMFEGAGHWGEGVYVVSQKLCPTKEAAAAEFSRYLSEENNSHITVDPAQIWEDGARYVFADEDAQHQLGLEPGERVWNLGHQGRGVKKVWVYET